MPSVNSPTRSIVVSFYKDTHERSEAIAATDLRHGKKKY